MRLAQIITASLFSAMIALPALAQTPAVTTPAKPAVTAPAATTMPATTAVKPATTAAKPVVAKPSPSAPVNINTATAEQLDALPGIGKVRAGKIIAARPYKSADELVSKKAIGPAEFAKIKDLITL